jgi:hypothetical protein
MVFQWHNIRTIDIHTLFKDLSEIVIADHVNIMVRNKTKIL